MGLSPLKGDFLADPLGHSVLKQELKKHTASFKGPAQCNKLLRDEQACKVFPCFH